jgi:diguanylate cyclase (GGDEF)-like protein/PAS domain S-box-containing protein
VSREEGTSLRSTARRLASTAVYLSGPLAVLGIFWLQRRGLVADTPMWLLVGTILTSGVLNFAGTAWLERRPESEFRLQARIAASVLTTGAVIYMAGWGAVLLIGFALGSAELLRVAGSRATRPNMIWNVVAIVAGEICVALGIAPSMIDPELGHAIAATGGLCLLILTDVLGRSARTAEEAEAEVRDQKAQIEDLVERATDIIGVIRAGTGTVESVSPAIRTVLGYAPDEVEGRPIADFLDPAQVVGLDDLLAEVVARRGVPVTIEIRLRHRDDEHRTIVATLTCPNESWNDYIVMNLHDITTQRELEDLLRHDARHDHLTGLLNRAAFSDASARAAAAAARKECSVGMLYIDLDGFKQINDSLGHETGDRVLVETAARLAGCLHGGEVLARLGGDEFAVLIESVDCRGEAVIIAERILEAVAAPIPNLRDDVRVGASIGIAVRGNDGIEISTLMREADEAMYSAKRNGRARWEFCDSVE